MEEIERKILNFFGCYTIEVTVGNRPFTAIVDQTNNSVGYFEYDKNNSTYHIHINSPVFYFDCKRKKGSKEIKGEYHHLGKPNENFKVLIK